ncbi:ribosome maturation factor RimP [Planctomycetota bacterium]
MERIESADYDVVEIKLHATRRLRVVIDVETGVCLADCQRASGLAAVALCDLGHDPGGFHIEVESPGADRPLTRSRDFERFRGSQVTVSLKEAGYDGRRNFTGTLVGATEDTVTVHVLDRDDPEVFDRASIRRVSLRPVIEKSMTRQTKPKGRHRKKRRKHQ